MNQAKNSMIGPSQASSAIRLVAVESWKTELLKVMLFLFPFTFSVDFKGDIGGTIIQVVMAVSAVFLFVLIVLAGKINASVSARRLIGYTFAVLLVGNVVAHFNEVPWDNGLRVFIPFGLFLAGLWCGCMAGNSRAMASATFFGMVSAALISVVFRYYYATERAGIDLYAMRYQVLSPTLCTLIAYVCASFCFMRRVSVPVLVVASATTVSILISVTRGYVITFAFALIGLVAVIPMMNRGNPKHQIYHLWRKIGFILVLFGLVFGLGFSYFLRPDVFEQWSGRLLTNRVLTQSGEDVNFISRIAEAKGIWEGVTDTTGGLVWGKGFGNIYYWSYDYVGEVGSVSTEMVNAMFAPTWWAAHSPFTYALFFGGVPALIWQIAIFAMPLLAGWRQIAGFKQVTDSRVLIIFVFNLLSVWLYLSQSLASNPFGERMSAQFLGLSAGMLLAGNRLLAEIFQRTTHGR